jgi:magnesium chelatase family protein
MSAATVIALTPYGVGHRVLLVQALQAIAGAGETGLTVTGPDGSLLHELRDRAYAGIINSRITLPSRRMAVSITPPGTWSPHADVDLAVVAALLIAVGQVPAEPFQDAVVTGEVGLDGAVRPGAETLSVVACAAKLGHRTVVVPAGNAREAALVPGVEVIAVGSVRDLVGWAVTGVRPPLPPPADRPATGGGAALPDLAQLPAALDAARFPLEVAAAGGHHLAVTATPGTPDLVVAHCLPSLLPDLDEQTAVQVTALHTAAGRTVKELIRRPPHHTSSIASVIGGRRPGVVTLAHRGVLLLDDAPEFDPGVLQALRQPLDAGTVQLARARGAVTYPAAFQLVLTCRPCPCPVAHSRGDTCPAVPRRAYRNRLGAVTDRIDITMHLDIPAPAAATSAEPSVTVAARVAAARAAAAHRWAADGYQANGDIPLARLAELQRSSWRLPPAVTASLTRLLNTGAIGTRGYGRILRLAWTVADLRGLHRPDQDAVATAAELHMGRPQ